MEGPKADASKYLKSFKGSKAEKPPKPQIQSRSSKGGVSPSVSTNSPQNESMEQALKQIVLVSPEATPKNAERKKRVGKGGKSPAKSPMRQRDKSKQKLPKGSRKESPEISDGELNFGTGSQSQNVISGVRSGTFITDEYESGNYLSILSIYIR